MFRRLPTFQASSFAATVGLFVLTSFLPAQPPLPPATPAVPSPVPIDAGAIKRSEEETRKLFLQFQEQVLRLAQRWEKSDNAEDKDRAKSLRAVLKIIEEKGVEKTFNELIEGLGKKTPTGGDFNTLLGKDKKLMEALEQILEVLNTESELDRLKKEIADLKKAIEAIQKLKREQENLRARTDIGKGDPDKLAKDQKDLAKETQRTADALDKKNQDPKAGNGQGGQTRRQLRRAEARHEGEQERVEGRRHGDGRRPEGRRHEARGRPQERRTQERRRQAQRPEGRRPQGGRPEGR
jgi:hypothetical protein